MNGYEPGSLDNLLRKQGPEINPRHAGMSTVNHSPPYDTVLRGGTLIDGTGRRPYSADLALKGDRIADIGAFDSARTAAELDVRGRCIAPGFIDAHAHDDQACLENPSMRAKISQGVTTVVVGNCGLSLAPLNNPPDLPEPLNLLGNPSDFRFSDFSSYFDAVDAAMPAANVVSLVGHTALRAATMQALDRRATPRELGAMLGLLDEAMRAGAAGLSSGVYYAPGRAADNAELIPLVRKSSEFGGVYASHIRDESDLVLDSMSEALAAARIGTAPLIISHHKCAGTRNWGRSAETLALLDKASESQQVSVDCYPYRAGSTVLDPAFVEEGIEVLVTRSRDYPGLAGRYLHQIASQWDCSEREAARRLQPGGACYFQMSERDVSRIIGYRSAIIGSDGLPRDPHPHPRLWGTFPRVIRRYVREQNLLSLEAAVHKMTGMTAQRFNITRRGTLAPGNYADIVVFDPSSIADRADFGNPKQPAVGIDYVFVNGQLSWGVGAAEAPGAGRLLRNRPAR